MTGITRQQAAEALAACFSTQTQYQGGGYDSWVVRDQNNKEWKFVSDASIHTERKTARGYARNAGYNYSVEMVTPKLNYDEITKLQEAVRSVRRAGAKVNASCGIHIHIDGINHNRQSLKNLLSIMYSKEDLIFKALKVRRSREHDYCNKVREPMLQRARELSCDETRDFTRLEEIWYGGNPRHSHYDSTRYHAINLHSMFTKGTVEFRMFNSTLHAGRVKAYVHFCLAISAQAITQRSAFMRKTHSTNEKFTFRTWLLRLGMIGDEFKNTRDHLLANLDGDRAWRYDKNQYECRRNGRAR